MTAAEAILEYLDSALVIGPGAPPLVDMPNTHFEPADAQLSVFVSGQHWIVVFDWIGYNPGLQDFVSNLFVYGSDLLPEHFDMGPGFLCWIHGVDLAPSYKLNGYVLEDYDELDEGNIYVTFPDGSVTVETDSETITFPIEETSVAAFGIPTGRTSAGAIRLTPAQLIRYLADASDHSLFRSEDAMLEVLKQVVDTATFKFDNVKTLLCTREWQHPDLAIEELPSATPSFQLLADVIASGDASLWKSEKIGTPNIDWRLHYAPND